MFVNVIRYFEMRLDTGEIKDKIWLNGDYQIAKNFFDIRKSMIDRKVHNKYKVCEFEKRNYYHTVVEAPGNDIDGTTKIIYTLSLKKQKVQFVGDWKKDEI